jgi:hypothetical protein
MLSFKVKSDFRETQRQLDRLSQNLQSRVIPAALNKVGAKARTEVVRGITSEFNIKREDVAKRMRLTKAGRKLQEWIVVLDPFASKRRGRSLNLIRFLEKKVTLAEGRRRKKSGTEDQLRFQVKRVGGKKIIAGAFIGNKGRTVFIRETNDRLPIKALSTIDVPQMFNTRRIQAKVADRIRRELPIEFERAIRAAIAGRF